MHRSLRYPPTNTLTGDALVRCEYAQRGEDDFDFGQCINNVDESADLRAHGVQRAVKAFLDDAGRSPASYQAHQLDGFRIMHLDGKHVLLDARRSQGPSNGRTGVISLPEIIDALPRDRESAAFIIGVFY